MLGPFLAFVADQSTNIDTEDLLDTKIGMKLKWLSHHAAETIRSRALNLHLYLRGQYKARESAVKRARSAADA